MDINMIISFVLLLIINLSYAQETAGIFEIREHSLSRPYPSVFSTSRSQWYLTGNTLATDRYIRLTPDAQSKTGGLWNTIPVTYPDWEMHVHFKIHGEGKQLFGDGIAIWYVRDPKLAGPALGYQDYFHGLAVILDTYANQFESHKQTYPYISAIVNNGSLHYNHDKDGADISIGGCESQIRGRTVDTLIAIRYQNNNLTVSMDVDGTNTWTECFSIQNINLPTHYYFGFTSATGQLSDNHDIISVHTYQLETSEERRKEDRTGIIPAAPSATVGETVSSTPTKSNWSALKIFLIIVGLIIVGGVGIGAYFYNKNRRYHSSRFY